MKKTFTLVAMMVLCLGLTPAFATPVLTETTYAPDGNNFTSPYAGVTVETFDNGTLSFSYTGNGAVVQDSASGHYAAPFGLTSSDTTKYLSVPFTSASGYVTVTLPTSATYNYLGLWWGSVDTYNTLEILKGDTVVYTVTGAMALSPANGYQGSGGSVYLNILNLPDFDGFRMSSTSYAFEVDNIAYGQVPEPSVLLLVGSGLAGLAAFRRKFKAA